MMSNAKTPELLPLAVITNHGFDATQERDFLSPFSAKAAKASNTQPLLAATDASHTVISVNGTGREQPYAPPTINGAVEHEDAPHNTELTLNPMAAIDSNKAAGVITRFNEIVSQSALKTKPERSASWCYSLTSIAFYLITGTFSLYCLLFKGAACGFQAKTAEVTFDRMNINSEIAFFLSIMITIANTIVTLIGQSLNVWFLFNGSKEHKENERAEWQNALGGSLPRKLIKLFILNFILMDAWLLSSISGRSGVMQLAEKVFNYSPETSDTLGWQSLIACQLTWLFFVKKALATIDRIIDIAHNKGFRLSPIDYHKVILSNFIHALNVAKDIELTQISSDVFYKTFLKDNPTLLDLNRKQQYERIDAAYHSALSLKLISLGVSAEEVPFNTNELLARYKAELKLQHAKAIEAAKQIAQETTDFTELNDQFNGLLTQGLRIDLPFVQNHLPIIKPEYHKNSKFKLKEKYYLTGFHVPADTSCTPKLKGYTRIAVWTLAGLVLCVAFTSFNSFALYNSVNNTVNNSIALPVTFGSMLLCFWFMGLNDIFKGTFSKPAQSENPAVNCSFLERLVGISVCLAIAGYQTLLMYGSSGLTKNSGLSYFRTAAGLIGSLGAFAIIRPLELMDFVNPKSDQKRVLLPDFYSLPRGERLIALIVWLSVMINAMGGITVIGALDKDINQLTSANFSVSIGIGSALWLAMALSTLSLSGKQAIENTEKIANQLHYASWLIDDLLYRHCRPVSALCRMLMLVISLIWKYLVEFVLFDIPIGSLTWLKNQCCPQRLQQSSAQTPASETELETGLPFDRKPTNRYRQSVASTGSGSDSDSASFSGEYGETARVMSRPAVTYEEKRPLSPQTPTGIATRPEPFGQYI